MCDAGCLNSTVILLMPKKCLKVLHVAETSKGGVGTIINHLTMGQTDVGCLVPDSHAADIIYVTPPRLATFKHTGRNFISLIRFTIALIQQVWAHNPQIVHLHSSFGGFAGRIVLLFMRLFGYYPKVVYTPHGFAFIMDSPQWVKNICALIERLLQPLAHAIILVSNFEQSQAKYYGIRNYNLHVIRNGSPNAKNIATINPFAHPNHINIIFIGRFDYAKGFDIALHIMQRLEGNSIHLTAIGANVQGNDIPQPVRSNITYTGWIAQDDMVPYLVHANVLLVTSRWESFCLAVTEAASYGVPALVSNRASLPELVEDRKTGLVFPFDDPERAVSILRTTTVQQWQIMGIAAKMSYQQNFTAIRMVEDTNELYRDILA